MSGIVVPEEVHRSIEAFLFLEARLADESRYDEWEELLTDDMHYWVPASPIIAGETAASTAQLSFINDNRARLATRLRQLRTGKRHAQTPASPMRRLLSNIEVLAELADGYLVAANVVVYELAVQASATVRLWPGRVTYQLRRTPSGYRLAAKTVELVTAGQAQPNLTFIL